LTSKPKKPSRTRKKKPTSPRNVRGSLRSQLAITVAALAFTPIVAVTFVLWATTPEARNQITWLVLAALGTTLVLAAGVGYFLARRILAPLDALERDMHYLKVSQRSIGDLRLPPNETPLPREVAILRERFEELLDHLRQAAEERELLVAALAHDLKTPILGAIRALDYLAEADDIGRENRVQVIRQIEGEMQRVYRLLENLLAASRIESLRPRAEPTDLRELAEALRLRHQARASKRRVSIEIEGKGRAKADRDMLERALDNLIDNAIRFARSRVLIRVGDGWVEVADDGPGLPGSVESLTKPYRSSRFQGVRKGSAGLGLFIARRVAEIHHGRLSACQSPLGGACLRIEANYNPRTVYETMETIW